jgi:micrococcal nuclease
MHRRALAGLLVGGLALHSCGSAPRPVSSASTPCVVARIADGDTFYCQDGRKVRLIGVDTPELGQGAPGREARSALERLLPEGTRVRLERDVTSRDRYGRELAYVWSGSRMVNEALVQEGWAVLYTVPPNVKYADRLERAQSAARAGGAGLWRSGGFACAPSSYRRRECGSAGSPAATPGRGAPGADR